MNQCFASWCSPCGYRLSLSDGSRWWISAPIDYIPWLDLLAASMELKKELMGGGPNLVFARRDVANNANEVIVESMRLDDVPWGGAHREWNTCDHITLSLWWRDDFTDVICVIKNDQRDEIKFYNMCCSCQAFYQRSIGRGGLPLHAGLVELNGRGALLVAPSGTGKSTCCLRFPDYWKPLCDDETLVVLDKQKRYRAHPFPTWSDYMLKRAEKTWNVQYSVPVSGVFFLEQSETDEVIPIGEGEAAALMTDSTIQVYQKFWTRLDREIQRKFMIERFNNACKIASAIPAFILRASLTGCFWEEMEKVL